MPDGDVARKRGEVIVGEDVRDQAHALVLAQVVAVADGDTGTFLATMLHGEQREVRLVGHFSGLPVDTDDATHGCSDPRAEGVAETFRPDLARLFELNVDGPDAEAVATRDAESMARDVGGPGAVLECGPVTDRDAHDDA